MSAKIFMCPPDYYEIDYEINPWMSIEKQAAHGNAIEQWNSLHKILTIDVGAEIVTVEPRQDVPDMVFTANAALYYKGMALISKFRHKERQPEEKYFAKWFKDYGYKTEFLPEGMCFEGAGDALFSGETLYAGYVPRTDISSHTYISDLFGIRVISLELTNLRFYHLDTCFCPLEDGYLMYFPEAFDEYGNKIIENNFIEEKRIVVTEEEAFKFSCNAVNVGKSVIMNSTTERLKDELRQKGFIPYDTDLSEFMKAGGAAKCLTLKLE